MTTNIVARRYAKALFTIGVEKGDAELAAYGKDLDGFAQVFEDAPELLRVFKNPIFSIEEKKAVLGKVLDVLQPSPMVRNFFSLLADNNRLAFAQEIQAYYGALLDEKQGVVRGELVTAIDLADAKQQAVVDQLKKQMGKELDLNFSTDPTILGGVVLKVGDKILDASLRAQLLNMKEQIKRGE